MINGNTKGKNYERKICQELRDMGYKAERSSYTNKYLDDIGKVDIETDFPWNIQCKRTESVPGIHKILDEMDTSKPRCIFWKKNRKQEIVIMDKETFFKLTTK